MFVTSIQPETNTVVLGTVDELERKEAWVRNLNLVKYESIPEPMEAITKIRYKDAGTQSTIVQMGEHMKVDFHHKVSGIAPGQSAVFYEGDDVIAGGIVQESGLKINNPLPVKFTRYPDIDRIKIDQPVVIGCQAWVN